MFFRNDLDNNLLKGVDGRPGTWLGNIRPLTPDTGYLTLSGPFLAGTNPVVDFAEAGYPDVMLFRQVIEQGSVRAAPGAELFAVR